ncbi:MAG: FadR family transcriptional regulator [Acidobacteria bacterium]|nr:FadR family transcriptional regulator [Acidobacteriota bacterium]
MSLKPVSRVTLGEQVASQLADQIAEGRWRVGEKLPTESELCATLGIGRSTLREALKSLAFVGMIRMKPGEGTYVAGNSLYLAERVLARGAQVTEKQIEDVGEARLVIETEMAALAAERAEPADLDRLESLLAEMGRCLEIGDGVGYTNLDVEFHLTIARCSKNLVLEDVLGRIRGALQDWIAKSQELPGVKENAQGQHAKIMQALRQRNPERARRAMRNHLETTEKAFTLLDKISKTAVPAS